MNDSDEGTREERITNVSLNHGILSPYTAFVGVERTGPKVNANDSKVRHIPIQISKGDEHLFQPSMARYSFPGTGFAYAPMPMSMGAMPPGGASRSNGLSGPMGPMYQSNAGSV